MTPPALPSLAIPPDLAVSPDLNTSPNLSRSPSTPGFSATTGRPAKWTKFHQAKLACLYLYTNLSVHEIVNVVYHKSSVNGKPPGKDSGNKKLNILLDNQPRWLRPGSHKDMGRRLDQLALAPSRMSSRSSGSAICRSSSDPPAPGFLSTLFKSEGSVSPTLLDVPHHSMNSWSAPTSPEAFYHNWEEWSPPQPGQTPQTSTPHPEERQDRALFASFLRRYTVTSTSTATSASSLKTILARYSSSYRRVVKALMRRLPGFSQRARHMSPVSEANSAVMDWLDDDAAPNPYDCAPFPLPGDMLHLDEYIIHQRMLYQHHRDFEDLAQAPATSLPWVTSNGLTEKGWRILNLNGPIAEPYFSDVDAFGNTLLHFVAARGTINQLYNIIKHPKARDILPKVNTAGQSFLHVISQYTMGHADFATFMTWLVGCLRQDNAMDIYAQDHYGRNFFHVLRANSVSETVLDRILEPNDKKLWNTRDAFGEAPQRFPTPMAYNRSSDSISPLDSAAGPVESGAAVTAQLQLVNFIDKAINQDPAAEYSQGRNGLHCLAAVNLGVASAAGSLNMAGSTPYSATVGGMATSNSRRRTGGGRIRISTDSSEESMTTRLNSLKDQLFAGVHPNAYDNNGHTPLMAFAAQLPEDGNYKLGPEILETLINNGADVNARNRAGETALHIAVRCGRKLAARALVEEGANVYARDSAGRSVLDVADAKIMAASGDCPREYARLEACRAWLSGEKGRAVQSPTVLDEWGRQKRK